MFDICNMERLMGNEVSYLVQQKYKTGLKITQVEMLAKNKVMRFTFNDSIVIKTICQESDTFSLETACYIALAKYLSVREFTAEGISVFAEQLKYYKRANKIVAAAIKTYNNSIKEKEKAIAAEKEAKLIKERQKAKKIRYKQRRKEKLAHLSTKTT